MCILSATCLPHQRVTCLTTVHDITLLSPYHRLPLIWSANLGTLCMVRSLGGMPFSMLRYASCTVLVGAVLRDEGVFQSHRTYSQFVQEHSFDDRKAVLKYLWKGHFTRSTINQASDDTEPNSARQHLPCRVLTIGCSVSPGLELAHHRLLTGAAL